MTESVTSEPGAGGAGKQAELLMGEAATEIAARMTGKVDSFMTVSSSHEVRDELSGGRKAFVRKMSGIRRREWLRHEKVIHHKPAADVAAQLPRFEETEFLVGANRIGVPPIDPKRNGLSFHRL